MRAESRIRLRVQQVEFNPIDVSARPVQHVLKLVQMVLDRLVGGRVFHVEPGSDRAVCETTSMCSTPSSGGCKRIRSTLPPSTACETFVPIRSTNVSGWIRRSPHCPVDESQSSRSSNWRGWLATDRWLWLEYLPVGRVSGCCVWPISTFGSGPDACGAGVCRSGVNWIGSFGSNPWLGFGCPGSDCLEKDSPPPGLRI